MTYSVKAYGALPNGTLCTKAIQAAIDACFLAGGGEVVIPEGEYVVGGLRLRSGVTLHLMENAVLMGSIDPEDYTDYINDTVEPVSEAERNAPTPTAKAGAELWQDSYPYSRWNNAIIRAIHAQNIAIIGERGSEICGQNCFDEQGEEGYRGPHAINMWFCENITLRGYTVRDSANWAHAIQNSQGITVDGITVLGGHDGFDVRTCDAVRIENCRFLTGDDCIAGFDNIDVTVRSCYFESACSILRFGGTDVLVEDCRGVAPTVYGHRYTLSPEEKRARADTTPACRRNCLNVFLYYCDNRAAIRRTPGNIVIRRCAFENVDAVMRLPFGHVWCCNRSLADITFEACTFDGVCMPMRLNCPAEEPLSLYMRDCTVTARSGHEGIPFVEGERVKRVVLERVVFQSFKEPCVICEPPCDVTKV